MCGWLACCRQNNRSDLPGCVAILGLDGYSPLDFQRKFFLSKRYLAGNHQLAGASETGFLGNKLSKFEWGIDQLQLLAFDQQFQRFPILQSDAGPANLQDAVFLELIQ